MDILLKLTATEVKQRRRWLYITACREIYSFLASGISLYLIKDSAFPPDLKLTAITMFSLISSLFFIGMYKNGYEKTGTAFLSSMLGFAILGISLAVFNLGHSFFAVILNTLVLCFLTLWVILTFQLILTNRRLAKRLKQI